ncbi:MAG: FAD-dependent oxidoreductase [Chloroflexi bacterium]|nr:FAD-dependent oxidoreductase [Chloroflexota bacterium]
MTDDRIGQGRHVVVVGGSFAGLGAAYTLRRRLRPEDRVTLISDQEQFVFAPSLIWAVLGQPLLHSSFALEPALRARGIDFLRAHVRQVDVANRRVATEDEELSYDRLLIATGGRPDTSAVPGLAGEFRAASWVVGEDSALEARDVLRSLFADPGPLVIGAAEGAGYLSAAYEIALALDTALRREGVRERVPITFVTAEPYLGHLGFGQTAARAKLETLFGERDIATRTDAAIEWVRRHEVRLAPGETLPARAIVMMPPFTGVVDVWKSAELTDRHGFIPVTEQYRHVKHAEVYAAGVASRFDRPFPPLCSDRAPQTGYLSLRMGKIAGQNLAASLGCGEAASRPLPPVFDVRVLDGGRVGLFLASRGTDRVQNLAYRLPGRSAHLLKVAVERYLLHQLRTGSV